MRHSQRDLFARQVFEKFRVPGYLSYTHRIYSMPPKPRNARPGAEDGSGPLRRRSPRGAGPAASRAVVQYDAHSPSVSPRRDGDWPDGSDEEWAQLPKWVARCQDRWDSRCQMARAQGISVRTTSSPHVPETAENRRRLSRAEHSMHARSHEAQLKLEEDTLPSRWEEEYNEAAALDQAMRDNGLTDSECEALWQDGVETVAWLQALREEDFLESGIDVKMRRKHGEAERRLQIARERMALAEESADPSALDLKETQYVDAEGGDFVWSPIDDQEHFARTGQTLDSRRREVQQRKDDVRQARLDAEEAAGAATKRRKKRDEEREAVERRLQGYRTQQNLLNKSFACIRSENPFSDTTQMNSWRNRGARKLAHTRSLRCGQLSPVCFP